MICVHVEFFMGLCGERNERDEGTHLLGVWVGGCVHETENIHKLVHTL